MCALRSNARCGHWVARRADARVSAPNSPESCCAAIGSTPRTIRGWRRGRP